MTTSKPILVTGASGFLAIHCIVQLLEQGYNVRGTLRTSGREAEVRESVEKFVKAGEMLEFINTDLMNDSGWDQAVHGCQAVFHVASPFPLFEPKTEAELIRPAVDGMLRVLRAAHKANIKRVVIVSSNAAVSAGHEGENRTFDENDWSNIDKNIGAYSKSKTLAERAAWGFINGPENVNKMEMTAVNPTLILGPIPNKDFPTSAELIRTLLLGQVPGVARLKMDLVDVRDVAGAMILALNAPEAAGQRFLCATSTVWLSEIVDILRKNYAGRGYKIPGIVFPNFMVELLALFDKKIALVKRGLNWDYEISNEKAKRILGWKPRSAEEAILSMANSLIEQGFA